MCAVPSAPGVAGVRVWAIMSRGRGPRGGPPPLEGVHVDYPPATEMLVRQPFISCSGLSCEWPTVANLLRTGRLRDHQPL